MMFKPGDIITLRCHDVAEEIYLVGKQLEVVERSGRIRPYWTHIRFEGKEYSIRGGDSSLVRKSPKKIKITDRIRAAMDGKRKMQYHDLMRAVFPHDQYPRAWNYQSNGGPPGCAMAFGAALRRMGMFDSGMGSARMVYCNAEEK